MVARRPKVEEIVPSAARTVRSLRDIGYQLPQAIADLVDNSIAAGANEIAVDLQFDGRDSWIRIADNGSGMNAPTLTEAMRYGTERDYATDDLGKFGFGLKTASTSQCRRVSVASRVAPKQARFEARCLDLDHIEATNRWEVLVLEGVDRPEHLTSPLLQRPGTVVLWENLDRVLEYKDPWGEWARRRLLGLAEEVDLHLGMVFHRFLSGDVRGRRLKLTVNGTKVEPWDPFCSEEPKTEELPGDDFRVTGDDGSGIVRVRPFVLPPQSEFSSDSSWRRASGPRKWNRQQGLYIYRANRLIQSGGWSRLRTADEHTKLARVALDFYPGLDAAFGINIAKAIVILPQELREAIDPLITAVTRRAQARYRSSGGERSGSTSGRRKRVEAVGTAAFSGSRPAPPTAVAPSGTAATASAHISHPKKVSELLEAAADAAGESAALKKIVRELRRGSPEVARELGW